MKTGFARTARSFPQDAPMILVESTQSEHRGNGEHTQNVRHHALFGALTGYSIVSRARLDRLQAKTMNRRGAR